MITNQMGVRLNYKIIIIKMIRIIGQVEEIELRQPSEL